MREQLNLAGVAQRLLDRHAGRLRQAGPFLLLLVAAVVLQQVSAQAPVPTFTIEDVVVDQSVTIQTANFPPYQEFVVTMGPSGTLGIDGTVVGKSQSGEDGVFGATYPIPANLVGAKQIALRLESPQGYFSYNWFYNNLEETAQTVPSFTIESVIPDESVTIRTNNYPAETFFIVTMDHMGTLGLDGIPVGTLNSMGGGTLTATFPIPKPLKGLERIAIRTDDGPYNAYNWFNNSTDARSPRPTMRICAVVRDDSVSIKTRPSFPPNRKFAVLLNFMGTQGEGGYVVGMFDSGPTGVAEGTYPIAAGLRGLDQIAVRAEEINGPHYSYNYFDNQTAEFCGS